MELFIQLAQQTVDSGDVFSKVLNLGVPTAILFWVIKFAFPSLLDRHDKAQTDAREHFEKILDKTQTDARENFKEILEKVESNRSAAAKDGHDAARKLGDAIEHQCEAIRQNSSSLEKLAAQVAKSA